MKFLRFTHPVDAALNAPITELAVWILKDTADRDKFEEIGDELLQKLKIHVPDEVSFGGRGDVEGNLRQFLVILGWQSLEVSLRLSIKAP